MINILTNKDKILTKTPINKGLLGGVNIIEINGIVRLYKSLASLNKKRIK